LSGPSVSHQKQHAIEIMTERMTMADNIVAMIMSLTRGFMVVDGVGRVYAETETEIEMGKTYNCLSKMRLMLDGVASQVTVTIVRSLRSHVQGLYYVISILCGRAGQRRPQCKHYDQLHRRTRSLFKGCSSRLFASPGQQFHSSFNLTASKSQSEIHANATWHRR